MGVILRVMAGEILIFYSMSFCSRTANCLQNCTEISGWEVLLFRKTDKFTIKAFENSPNFLTVKSFNL